MTTNPREVKLVSLDDDFDASWQRVEELRAGRKPDDIHLNDEYWLALKKHQQAHNKKD